MSDADIKISAEITNTGMISIEIQRGDEPRQIFELTLHNASLLKGRLRELCEPQKSVIRIVGSGIAAVDATSVQLAFSEPGIPLVLPAPMAHKLLEDLEEIA